MNFSDKINRSFWTMIEGIKSATLSEMKRKVVEMNIQISKQDLEKMCKIVESTIETSYHNAARVLNRELVAMADEEKKKLAEKK